MTQHATTNNKLFLYRGLPGSGKTTAANKLGCLVVSPADMFSMVGGEYRYNDRIGEDFTAEKTKTARTRAMMWARSVVTSTLTVGADVALATVCPTRKGVKQWMSLAEYCGADFVVIDMHVDIETSLARNVHNVPEESIRHMANIWQDWN